MHRQAYQYRLACYFFDKLKLQEYLLLKESKNKNYEYYHFISGVDLPLKTQDEIHDFFQKNNGKEIVQKLVDAGKIEVKGSQFLRGNNIDSSIVLISESQNFSRDTFLKILTRIGTNSKYIFNSDEMQLDSSSLKSGKNQKGLQYAVEKLSDMDEIGIVEFGLEDVVRNDLIPSILKRWLPEVYGDLDEEEISKRSKQERLDE